MELYHLQSLYARIGNPRLRRTLIKAAKAVRKRYLLLRLDTNDTCNLRCRMCYFSDPDRKPIAKAMSEEMFARLAAEFFPHTRFLYLSCGAEPFTTPHFDKILDLTGPFKVPFVSFCTNGLLFKPKFIEATLRNAVSEVIFSVDGATRETYEAIRSGGSWDKLGQRLTEFNQARSAWSGPVPELRFNFTIQDSNAHEILPFMEWVRQWQPSTVQLRLFRTLKGAVKQKDDDLSVNLFLKVIAQVRQLAKESGIRLLTMDTPDDRQRKLDPNGESPKTLNCQLPWFNLFITANGDVHPCTVHEPVGNFLDEGLAAIENGERMRQLRASLKRAPRPGCITCQRTGASGV